MDRAVADLEAAGGWQEVPPVIERKTRAAEFTAAATALWTDEDLERALGECWDDPEAVSALEGIIDARDPALVDSRGAAYDQEAVAAWPAQPAWTEPDTLTSPARRTSRTKAQVVRAEYEAYLDVQWLQAESDCNGQLLKPASRAAGIDSRSLFSGPINRALKHASEELQSWWAKHGRLTLAAFRHQALGWDSDREAAQKMKFETFDNAPAW